MKTLFVLGIRCNLLFSSTLKFAWRLIGFESSSANMLGGLRFLSSCKQLQLINHISLDEY